MNGAERVFVTGASGLLGANLVRRLVADGTPVRILLRSGSSHPFLDRLPLEVVRGDLTTANSVVTLANSMQNCTQVYHCAGRVSYKRRDRAALWAANVEGTARLLQAAREAGVRRVVQVSSTVAVGIPACGADPLDEAALFEPRFWRIGYMATKRYGEELAFQAQETSPLEVVIVNPCTIYGAGDVALNSGALFQQLARRPPRFVPPGGTSVVAVADVVAGLLLAMARGVSGRRYILRAEDLSYRALFDTIAREIGTTEGSSPTIRTLPPALEPLAAGLAGLAEETVGRLAPHLPLSAEIVLLGFSCRYFTAQRARTELGWAPRVSFPEAVREAIAFYRGMGVL